MIDPSFDSPAAVLDEGYPTVEALQTKVADLEKKLENMTRNYNYVRDNLTLERQKIANLEEYVKDNHEYISDEVLEEITSIMGFTLTKEYDVTITVRWSGTVTAPLDFDMDYLSDTLSVSLDTGYGTPDVDVDVSEDDTEVEWVEA